MIRYKKKADYYKLKEEYDLNRFDIIEINKTSIDKVKINRGEILSVFKKAKQMGHPISLKSLTKLVKVRKIFDQLNLPSYCGHSIDSVHDCFYDEIWTKGKKIVIFIKDIKQLKCYEDLLPIFKDIINQSKKSDFKFEVIVFDNKMKKYKNLIYKNVEEYKEIKERTKKNSNTGKIIRWRP